MLTDEPVIDVHAHIFNVNYLPLCGIGIAHGMPRPLAKVLDKVLTELTAVSDLEPRLNNLAQQSETDRLVSMIAQVHLTNANKREVDNNNAYKSLSNEPQDQQRARAIFELMYENKLLVDHHTADDHALLTRDNYARFVYTITRQETTVVDLIRSQFPETDLFVHHMMDMDAAYNDRSRFPVMQQIDRFAELARQQKGSILTFVAFDPFRRSSALDPVKAAMAAGAIGVKFYPPSGYSASQNEINELESGNRWQHKQWKSRYRGLTPDELNRLCKELFEYCDSEDPALSTPVFTHCESKGFEAVPGYGGKSDPIFWKKVLEEHKALRLGLGHAGGYNGWYDDISHWDTNVRQDIEHLSFEEKAYQLAIQYENVYLDFGYHERIIDADDRAQFVRNLVKLIAADEKADGKQRFRFSDKIMFGTDWHMSAKVQDPTKLYEAALQVFGSDNGLERYRTAFFAGNAARFLNLEVHANGKIGRLTAEQQAYLTNLLARVHERERADQESRL